MANEEVVAESGREWAVNGQCDGASAQFVLHKETGDVADTDAGGHGFDQVGGEFELRTDVRCIFVETLCLEPACPYVGSSRRAQQEVAGKVGGAYLRVGWPPRLD